MPAVRVQRLRLESLQLETGMRMWFAPGSEVPLYRQLGTQIVLAILAGELKPGERLPSTRAFARLYGIHPNTVSAAYQALEAEAWVASRRGSGVYVREQLPPTQSPNQTLELHIAQFFRSVREMGVPMSAVRAEVARWMNAAEPDHFLLIEGDEELRRILATELCAMTSSRVDDASPDDCRADPKRLGCAILLCRPSRKRAAADALPLGVELVTLPINSVPVWMGPLVEATMKGELLAVVSHWPAFLDTSRTMLLAAGVPSDALLFRNANESGWERGLAVASALLCDAFTAKSPALPKRPRMYVFPLLAEGAKDVLAAYRVG